MTEQEQELYRKVQALEKEKNYLHQQIKEQRYGLTWIDVPEAFDAESENKIPILEEVPDKSFTDNSDKPTHILIEGDNYHALQCLNYTHKGKVDVIYIDPPYNLDKDDFVYNDSRLLKEYPDGKPISKDDPLRHSSWLSFMYKRLTLAKELLALHGVAFISIDEHELCNLKLLCDKIFDASNYISCTFILDNLKGKTNDNFITSVGSRLLVYAKDKAYLLENGLSFNAVENVFGEKIDKKYPLHDDIGSYQLITFKKTGLAKLREDRPNMYFPILAKDGILYSITPDEYSKIYDKTTHSFNDSFVAGLKTKYINLGYEFILPLDSNNAELRWTSTYATFCNKINIDIVYSDGKIMQKNRPSASEFLQEYASGTPKSIFYKPSYANGTDDIKRIFGKAVFSFPKPIDLIKDLLKLPTSNSLILDFFAGSGTTLQAVLEQNDYDHQIRQCILVQEPEKTWKDDSGNRVPKNKFETAFNAGYNTISEITYERNRRVMQGYTNASGEQVAGLGGSLKYYKTAFVNGGRNDHDPIQRPLDSDKVALAKKAGILISVAENTLYRQEEPNEYYEIFTDKQGKFAAVYKQEDYARFDEFENKVKSLQGNVVVYTFSWSNTPDAATNFLGFPNVEVKAFPNAIIDSYNKAIKQIENNK